jgi:TonB family protein
VLVTLAAAAACMPLDYVPTPPPETLPSCHPGLVGVRSQTLQERTRGEITDQILGEGWVSADALLVVELDEPPSLRNPRDVAVALQEAYPASLRDQGIGGAPEFALLVDRTGTVRDVALLASSGHPELDAAGETVVRTASFTPAVYHDCRPLYWTTYQARFTPR